MNSPIPSYTWALCKLFCQGLIFLFVLPHPWYSHKTYFSENALLPGLVTGEFNEHKTTKR